jgi:hypothetical protein
VASSLPNFHTPQVADKGEKSILPKNMPFKENPTSGQVESSDSVPSFFTKVTSNLLRRSPQACTPTGTPTYLMAIQHGDHYSQPLPLPLACTPLQKRHVSRKLAGSAEHGILLLPLVLKRQTFLESSKKGRCLANARIDRLCVKIDFKPSWIERSYRSLEWIRESAGQ